MKKSSAAICTLIKRCGFFTVRTVCIGLLFSALTVPGLSYAYSDAYPLPGMTGNYRKDMIAVANSQLGYAEDKNGGSVYAAEIGGADNALRPWCTEFIAWCARNAGIPETVIPNALGTGGMRETFSAMGRYYILNNGRDNDSCGCGAYAGGRSLNVQDLVAGDIILTEGSNSFYTDGPGHTALVLGVYSDNNVLVISGNNGDLVRYSVVSPWKIHGVCRPDYTQASAADGNGS